MDLKVRREKELLVHKAFYRTTHILTLIYFPTKDFKEVFKEDMFMKNNKNGFQQVAYYLLNILDPENLKKNVIFPYDLRTENQFRSYLIKFVNELNVTNLNVIIPPIVMSQLVSPSGLKCTTLLLGLAQLALGNYLQSKPTMSSKLLLQIKPSNNSQVTTERLTYLRQLTSHTYNMCNTMETDFTKHLSLCKTEAASITSQIYKNVQVFKENQTTLKMLQASLNERCSDHHDEKQDMDIEEKLKTLQSLNKKIKHYDSALSLYLSSKTAELKHNLDITLPLVKQVGQDLDLTHLFGKFIQVLDHKRLQIKPLDNQELIEQNERIRKLNQQLTLIRDDIILSNQEYSKLCDEQEDGFVEFWSGSDDDTNSTPMATPLPQSPVNSTTILH